MFSIQNLQFKCDFFEFSHLFFKFWVVSALMHLFFFFNLKKKLKSKSNDMAKTKNILFSHQIENINK